MAANKRLSAVSGHLHPSLSHGEKYRRWLVEDLRKVRRKSFSEFPVKSWKIKFRYIAGFVLKEYVL